MTRLHSLSKIISVPFGSVLCLLVSTGMTPELKRLRITNIVLGILTAVVGMHFNQGMANYGSAPRITIYTGSIHSIKLFTASQQVMRHGILRKISRDIYG